MVIKKTLQRMAQNIESSLEIKDNYLTLKFTQDDKVKLILIEKYKSL